VAGRHHWTRVRAARPGWHRPPSRAAALVAAASLGLTGLVSLTALAIVGAPAVTAAAAACQTPASLSNGSFETPVVAAGADATALSNSTPDIGWQTTAADAKLEFWKNGGDTTTQNSGTPAVAQDGSQWAELSADQAGTLFQDVTTTPGQQMRWSLWHRGRHIAGEPLTGTDSMKVQLGDPAATMTDQIPDGQSVADISDGYTDWVHYTGSYLVPSGQTTTRLQFVGLSTYSGDPAVGNWIDAVSFASTPCLQSVASVHDLNPDSGALTRPGDTLRYSVVVTNNGGAPAGTASLADPIPTGTSYVASTLRIDGTPVTDATGDDTGEVAGSQVVARLGVGADSSAGGVLAPGASSTVSFDVTVDANTAAGTTISELATASYTWAPDAAVLSGDSTTVTSTVDVTTLAVSGTVTGTIDANSNGRVDAGDELDYSLTATDTGSTALTAVDITDSAGAASCASTSLAAGASTTCTGSYVVTQADVDAGTGSFIDTVKATGTPSGGAAQISSAAVPVSHSIAVNPDFAATKTADRASYLVGEPITYTVTIGNSGGAGSASFADQVPAGVTVTTVSCSAPGPATCSTSGPTGNLVSGSMVIPAAGQVTYTIVGVVAAGGSVANSATITPITAGCTSQCGGGPAGTGPLTANANPVFTQSAAADSASYIVGQPITYQLTVGNTGYGAGTATVHDAVPTIVTVGSMTCSATVGSTCNTTGSVGNILDGTVALAPGGSAVYTVTGTLNAPGNALDQVKVTPSDLGCVGQCGGGTASTPALAVTANPVFTQSKSADRSHYLVGEPIIYTVAVHNAGAGAGSASVSDSVPANVSVTSVSCQTSASATCDTTASAGNSVQAQVVLPAGGTATLLITGTVTAAGSATNAATVTPTDVGCVAQCGGGAASTNPLPALDNPVFTQTKTADRSAYIIGQPITYTIAVTNTGAGVGTATLSDPVPPAVHLTAVTCSASAQSSCDSTTFSGNLASAALTLAPGGSATYTVSGTVLATGSVANTATVTPTTDGCSSQCGGGAASTGPLTAKGNPFFTLTKTADSNAYIIGQPITYTITVANTGTGAGTASLTDQVNSTVAVATVTCSGTGGATCQRTLGAGGSISGVVSVPAASVVTYTITGTVVATGSVANLVAADPVYDPSTNPSGTVGCSTQCGGDAAGTGPLNAVDNPVFTQTKTADSDHYIVGQAITYTVTVHNTGLGSGNVRITDTAPAGVHLTGLTCTPSALAQCSSAALTADVVNVTAVVRPGNSVELVLQGIVLSAGDLDNRATVTPTTPGCVGQCGGGFADTGPLPAVDNPMFTQTITANRLTYNVGQPITYLITVANAGAGAGTASVTDPVPADVVVNHRSCTATGPSTCSTVGSSGNSLIGSVSLVAGGSAVFTITGIVNTVGDAQNAVTVDAAYDPLTNPDGTVGCTTQCGGGVASTVALPAAPTAALTVRLSKDRTMLTAGLPVTYTATVTNNGPNAAAHLTTLEPVAAVVLHPVAAPDPRVAGGHCSVRATTAADLADLRAFNHLFTGYTVTDYPHIAVCEYPSLVGGASVAQRLTGTVRGDLLPASVVQTAVAARSDTFDSRLSDNAAAVIASSDAQADLTLTQTAANPVVPIGDLATLTVIVVNHGPSSARGVVVEATSSGMQMRTAVFSQGTFDPYTGRWTIGTLASGSSAKLVLLGTVGPNSSSTAVILSSQTPDPNPADNGARSCAYGTAGCGYVTFADSGAPLAYTGVAVSRDLGWSALACLVGFGLVLAGRRRSRP
jgi:uncharacterized repeat protein (TIGR01451 family)